MEPTNPTNPTLKPGVYQGTPAANPETKEAPVVRVIHTMKNDMADAITKQNETAASIALAETKKQERQKAEALAAKQAELDRLATIQKIPKQRSRTFIIFALVLVLIALSFATFKFLAPSPAIVSIPIVGNINLGKTSPDKSTFIVPQTPTITFSPSLIQPQSEKRFIIGKVTPDAISGALTIERVAGVAASTVKNLYFGEESTAPDGTINQLSVPANRLLSFLGTQTPDSVLRSIEPRFMFGLLGEEGSIATPFIVLKISDYEASRAGMLLWEPNLTNDFDKIFGTKIISIASSPIKFRDIIVAAHDARILNAVSDKTLVYSFIDNRTIVIAGSRTALENIIILLEKK